MSLATFIDQLFAGLGLAFVLFFTAAGLNLVWGVLGVMNFAAGAVYMLGAYLTTSVIARLGASALGWTARAGRGAAGGRGDGGGGRGGAAAPHLPRGGREPVSSC